MQNRLMLFCGIIITFTCAALHAKTVTREEALRLAFPGAEIQSNMIFLTDQQMMEASTRAGSPIQSALIARYTAITNGTANGRAYLDTHVVRTKKESLLIILNQDGTVRRVEVIAFEEPSEYQPIEKWYDQFQQKSLNQDLSLQTGIHPVTGASLTARATLEAVRRILAIDAVLQQQSSEKKK